MRTIPRQSPTGSNRRSPSPTTSPTVKKPIPRASPATQSYAPGSPKRTSSAQTRSRPTMRPPKNGTGSGIYARDPASGKLLWSAEVAERANQLIVANGRLFASTRQGTIYAFAPEAAKKHGMVEEAIDAGAVVGDDWRRVRIGRRLPSPARDGSGASGPSRCPGAPGRLDENQAIGRGD